MAKLIYATNVSLDGYIEDAHGGFEWTEPTDEVFTVYSTTLGAVSTANTRLERSFAPDVVRDMKASAASDLTIGGSVLAAHAFNAGLVDECHLFVCPVVVGGGKPAFASDARVPLELQEEHGFGNGVVYLRYRTGLLD